MKCMENITVNMQNQSTYSAKFIQLFKVLVHDSNIKILPNSFINTAQKNKLGKAVFRIIVFL